MKFCNKTTLKNEMEAKEDGTIDESKSKSSSANDFVYYWDNDILKKTKFLRADEYSLLTEDGEFLYDEVGETWFLTKFVAKMKKEA